MVFKCVFTMAATAIVATAQSRPEASVPTDTEIRKILVDRIDVQHQSIGIVVGVLSPEGRRVIAYGHLEKADPRPLNGDTIFEIGSATKVFTSLLLAHMVQRGQVALDDPVGKYLPSAVKMPERNRRVIALIDLATHRNRQKNTKKSRLIRDSSMATWANISSHRTSLSPSPARASIYLSRLPRSPSLKSFPRAIAIIS